MALLVRTGSRKLSTASGAHALAWASGIQTTRYPLHDLSSASGRQVVEEARQALATTGCASFPGFLRPEVCSEAAAEAVQAAKFAFVCDSEHNAYQLPAEPGLPETHVRNLMMRTRVASTAWDEVQGPLRRLYEYDGLVEFVGAVLGDRPLYRLADPLGCCSVNIFRPGWYHAWHFDESEYTTTLSLQQSEAGGEFEFTVSSQATLQQPLLLLQPHPPAASVAVLSG